MVKDWADPVVSEPLAVLLGAGRQNIEAGQVKLAALRKQQVQQYVKDLESATFFRKGFNGRFQDMLGS